MAITRSRITFEDHFTQVPNSWMRDQRLSRRARGLLAELMTHRPGWRVSITGLVRTGTEGRDAIRTAVVELEKHGYLIRGEKMNHDELGRFLDMDYTLTDPWGVQPVLDFPSTGEPSTGEPTSANPHPKKNISSEDHLEEDQSKKLSRDALVSAFDAAYAAWPKKANRKKAFARFEVVARTRFLTELVGDIQRFGRAYAAATTKQFVPGLDSWLLNERWTDDLPTPKGRQAGSTSWDDVA